MARNIMEEVNNLIGLYRKSNNLHDGPLAIILGRKEYLEAHHLTHSYNVAMLDGHTLLKNLFHCEIEKSPLESFIWIR